MSSQGPPGKVVQAALLPLGRESPLDAQVQQVTVGGIFPAL